MISTHIRNAAHRLLGLQTYLRIVSYCYIRAINAGCWKQKYPELFYLKKIIKPGFVCIDIGANLGYYSNQLAKLVGNSGKVYAVEPIPLFANIWKKNCKPHTNYHVALLPYALGEKTANVRMGIPVVNGRLHHGMTKISSLAQEEYAEFYSVPMENPDLLFAHLSALNFIKCDVEGYESEVFKHFTKTIQAYKPIIQTELSGQENRLTVIELLTSMGYTLHILQHNAMKKITVEEAMDKEQDFYFLP